ncbi:MAG: XdhC family protein [Eubacterium sp.]|nr:XdhC family protein [Eubacterium sp.]
MKELYELLTSLNPNCDNRLLTVIDGEYRGEKLLLSDHKCVWQSSADGFFAKHPEVTEQTDSGLLQTDEAGVYAEQITGGKKIVICGAGHVGIAIARIGKMIGCDVTVIDDRMSFADQAREAGVNVICDAFTEALKQIPGDANTWFVIVTRGHKWDKVCLKEIAQKPHAYIGLMGSRRRVKIVMQNLAEEGIDPEVLSRVYTPVGLKIGAETPEEIAVSVMAEIIQVKNQSGKDSGYPRDILEAILGDHHEEQADSSAPRILMTIVNRKGSAPREAGAKMVLLEDGYTTAGTIGGGCVEADTLVRARRMLQEPECGAELLHVNMTAEEAEEEGMVCGGTVDILLEKI